MPPLVRFFLADVCDVPALIGSIPSYVDNVLDADDDDAEAVLDYGSQRLEAVNCSRLGTLYCTVDLPLLNFTLGVTDKLLPRMSLRLSKTFISMRSLPLCCCDHKP